MVKVIATSALLTITPLPQFHIQIRFPFTQHSPVTTYNVTEVYALANALYSAIWQLRRFQNAMLLQLFYQ